MYPSAEFDTQVQSDQIVDVCLEELGSNADQLDLLRCITKSYTKGFDSEFWTFSRNVLLVYSTGESEY
jgi:hypothetical protein